MNLPDDVTMNFRIEPLLGSHLPLLIKLINVSQGPVLELGMGMYSTPYLHWACYESKRRLVSYESNPDWFMFAQKFRTDFHDINCISDWDSADLSGNWSVALVDHEPTHRRGFEISKIINSEYIVVHDTQKRVVIKTRMYKVFRKFKYRYQYAVPRAEVTILSNIHNLANFSVL